MDAQALLLSKNSDPFYTVDQAAEYLQLSGSRIRKAIARRELAHSRTCKSSRGHIRIRQSALDAWMRRNETTSRRLG